MDEPLISLKDYEALCESGVEYIGYVWTEEGKIYHVMNFMKTVMTPFPTASIRAPWGWQQGKTFLETVKVPVITEENLGSNDVLYDTNGNFIAVITANDPIKGEIKILKNFKQKSLATIVWSADNIKKYDIANLEDIKLTAEAYSKIFTHVLSLMMKSDMENIRNKSVSVELYDEKHKLSMFNLDYRHIQKFGSRTDAYYSPNQGKVIAAILYKYNSENLHLYSTVWNIINNLGAHELKGHGATGWWDDLHRTHHLVYLYQMGHPSWKNTTKEFQESMKGRLNSYYSDYSREEYEDKHGISGNHRNLDNFNGLRSLGLYPPYKISGTDSINFNERLSKDLQKKINMKNPYQ